MPDTKKLIACAVEEATGRLQAQLTRARDKEVELKALIKEEKKRNRDFKTALDSSHENLTNARLGNRRFSRLKVNAPRKLQKTITRFIVPDVHGCNMDRPAVDAMLHDLAKVNPDEIVLLGDLVEAGGFLAQHHTLGYVSLTKYSYEEDLAAAAWLLDRIQERSPKAKIHYVEGNHEVRVARWALTQAQRHDKDADYLVRQHHARYALNLQERGIEFYDLENCHHGLSIPGAIKLKGCHFVHGISIATHAAAIHVKAFNANVVYGHTHRRDSYTINTVGQLSITGENPGCLCTRQPVWLNGKPAMWSHGYGLQYIAADGFFQHINALIVNGRSLLAPLL